jgi:phospholipase/lecithinase/hemolysin
MSKLPRRIFLAMSSSLPTYGAIYAFGDSLSDAGNLSISTAGTTPVSPPYYKQQYGILSGNVFSNGPTWVQNLSIALGLGTLAPSLAGGTDFAYGGAETGSTPQNADLPAYAAISLPAQLSEFRTQVPSPSANALYTLSVGANDIDDILATPTLTAQQQTTDVNTAVANEISFVSHLIGDGARNLLVLDVPDLGKIPEITQGLDDGSDTPSAGYDAQASQLASEYNTALNSQLAGITGVNVHVVNTYALLDDAIADPAAYGLTNVTTPVWNGSFTSASSGTLAATTTAEQDQYLFWDDYHPTETGHQAIAESAETELSGTVPLIVTDTTTGQTSAPIGQPYTGPVSGLQEQYVNITSDSLNIAATTPNWFIASGSGNDAIAVSSGTNVVDGGTGSNFLTGGAGDDTFFTDDRGLGSVLWDTVNNFHAGDAATIWGVTPSDFALSWVNGQGATGYTGLTLHVTAAGVPTASLTLTGLTSADLTNGTLTVSYGTTAATTGAPGSTYMYIHNNG